MQKLPIFELPESILDLCSIEDPNSEALIEYVANDQFLLNLIEYSYPLQLRNKNLKEFLSGLGFDHAVLYICGIYIQKTLLKTNPGQVLPEILDKLLGFYKESVSYVDDSSRVLLLTCYLGLIDSSLRSLNKKSRQDLLKFPMVVKTLLGTAKVKVSHFDILYLALLQLDSFEKLENIQKFIIDDKPFSQILKKLPEEKQTDFFNNFINYGQSIREFNLFHQELGQL